MKIAIITINKEGSKLAERLRSSFSEVRIFNETMALRGSLKNLVKGIFNEFDGLIFIAALGIVVRVISPLLRDKSSDPAVVSVDTAGRFAVSALSGHEGGANSLAYLVAGVIGASPVITTGTEAHKKVIVGIGSRRGISADKVKRAIRSTLREEGIGLEKVRLVATIDLKKDEAGLIRACRQLGLPLVFIPKEDISNFKTPSSSGVVKRRVGLDGVCEPCALLAGRKARLILKKKVSDGVTLAIAREGLA